MKKDRFWQRMQKYAGHAWLLTSKGFNHRLHYFLDREKYKKRFVFVGGMQRSGTNMVMDVLERSYETDVYHERDSRAFDNYRMRERAIIHKLADESKAPVFIIKALCELQYLRPLMDEFSPAQALWIVRDYEDVVNSMLVSFRNQAKQVRRIIDDRRSGGWLGEGMSDETYNVLRNLVHPEMNDASGAALQWYFRNQLYFDQGFENDPRVMLVNYESLVSDPQLQFKNVFLFLGLRYTPRVSSSVFASSIRRRSSPDIEPPVRELCEDLKRRFSALLHVGRISGG